MLIETLTQITVFMIGPVMKILVYQKKIMVKKVMCLLRKIKRVNTNTSPREKTYSLKEIEGGRT